MCLDGPSNLRITASPDNMVYTSGSAISLSCSVESKPTASFYWTYNGNPLNVYSSSYNLTDTTQYRTGQYTCVAQNEVTHRYAAVTKNIRIVGENTLEICLSTFLMLDLVIFLSPIHCCCLFI